MKDILTAPFMVEMIRTTTNMYAQGWDERNSGNISLLLYEEEEDIPALTALAEEQSKLGSVLLLRNKPEQLRCARILKYTDGRLEQIEDHG